MYIKYLDFEGRPRIKEVRDIFLSKTGEILDAVPFDTASFADGILCALYPDKYNIPAIDTLLNDLDEYRIACFPTYEEAKAVFNGICTAISKGQRLYDLT